MKKSIFIVLFFITILIDCFAAAKEFRDIRQPNGAVFSAYWDEELQMYRDKEGHAILYNLTVGCFTYGVFHNGIIMASDYIVGMDNPVGVKLPKSDFEIKSKIQLEKLFWLGKMPEATTYKSTTTPQVFTRSTGTVKPFIIFLSFKKEQQITNPDGSTTYITIDTEPYDSQDEAFIRNALPKKNDGNPSSITAYFNEVSRNMLSIEPQEIFTYHDDEHTHSYYCQIDGGGADFPSYRHAAATSAEYWQRLQYLFNRITVEINKKCNEEGITNDYTTTVVDGKTYIDSVVIVVDQEVDLKNRYVKGLIDTRYSSIILSQNITLFGRGVSGVTTLIRSRNNQNFDVTKKTLLLQACHEFYHSLSAPDMADHFSNQTSGYYNPLLYWDVMGGNEKITHMLSYMKWKYGGWLREESAIREITPSNVDKNGYTLQKSSSPNGTVAYKIISPYSKNPKQYFMLEYREKSGEFEVNIPNSGIIVYGVNEDKRGNSQSYKDSEAYIFRPGVKIVVDSDDPEQMIYTQPATKGNIEEAWLKPGGITGLTSIINLQNGNPDPRVDPQLRLFDGTPAGFRVYDVVYNGDTATFKIEFEKTCSEFRIERESPERVKEDVGEVKIKIKRSDFLSTTARIRVFTKDITAEAGKDYTSVSQEVIFEPEDKEKQITIPIILDTVDEEDESFEIVLEKIDETGIPSSESGTAKFVIIGTSITTGSQWSLEYNNYTMVEQYTGEPYGYPDSYPSLWKTYTVQTLSRVPLEKNEFQSIGILVDLDNDGLSEAVAYIYNYVDGKCFLKVFKITGYEQTTAGTFPKYVLKSTREVGHAPEMLAAADMDNDGLNDLVGYNSYNYATVVYNRGNFTVSQPRDIDIDNGVDQNDYNQFIQLVDCNADGYIDILTDSFGVLNRGSSFQSISIPRGDFYICWIAKWLDIDNDGDYDAIISGHRLDPETIIPGYENFGDMYVGAVFNQTRVMLLNNGTLTNATQSNDIHNVTVYNASIDDMGMLRTRSHYHKNPWPSILFSIGEGAKQMPSDLPSGYMEITYKVNYEKRNIAPEAPQNLRYGIQGTSLVLQWDPAEDLNSPGGNGLQYHVVLSGNQGVYDLYSVVKNPIPNAGCSLKKILPTSAISSLVGVNKDKFTFIVYAIDPNGLVSPSSVPCEIVLNPQQKTMPGQNQAAVTTTPTMEWPADNAAVSYNLRISTSPMSIPIVMQSSRSLRSEGSSPVVYENITTNNINLSDLTYNTVYYWQYQSVYADSVGEWSDELSFTTCYPSITNIQVSFTKTSSTVSWNYSSANPAGIRIQRHVLGITEWETVFTSNEPITSWQDNAFYENCYEYRIQEYSDINTSGWVQFVCDNSPLLNPANVAVTPDNGAYIITWESGSEKATGYAVYLQQENGSWVELYRGGVDVSEYRFETDLLIASFKVCSVNAIKESGGVVRFIDMRDLPKVKHFSVALQDTTLQLRWFVDFGGFYEYEIEKSVNGSVYESLLTIAYDTVSTEDTVVAPGVYRYRIRVRNTWKQSEWLEAVFDNRYLNAPENLTATMETNSIVLAWQSSNVEQTVTEIERKVGEEAFAFIATTAQGIKNFTDTTLSNALLTYRVREKADTLVSPWSQEVVVDNRILSKPSITTIIKSDNSWVVTWDQLDAHAVSLVVQRKIDGGDFVTVTEVAATDTSYTDASGVSGSSVSYRIQAKNSFRVSEWSDVVTVVTQTLQKTEIAAIAYQKLNNRIALSWVDNNTNETGYEIWRAQHGQDVFIKHTTVSADTTQYYDNNPVFYSTSSYILKTLIGDFIITISEFDYRYKIRAAAASTFAEFSSEKDVQGCKISIRYSFMKTSSSYSSITTSKLRARIQDAQITLNGVPMTFEEFEQYVFQPKKELLSVGVLYSQEESEKTALWYAHLPYNREITLGNVTLIAKTDSLPPIVLSNVSDIPLPNLPVIIDPFYVKYGIDSGSLIHVRNRVGETGVLLRYDDGVWKVTDYSRDVLSIKGEGVYALCKDSNYTVIPRLVCSALKQNFPNPFNPTTTIFYDIVESGHVVVAVYNAKGKLVNTLVDAWMSRGAYSVIWNGTDMNGRAMPSGVYYAIMNINGMRMTRKMVLLK